jgi:hypothetical protein
MGPNMYLYQKAREEQVRDLRREMAQNRWVAHRQRSRLSRRVAGKLGALLLKLGSRLKQFEQAECALKQHGGAEWQRE